MFSGTHHLPKQGPLPLLDGATGWLNTGPLRAEELRGKVVLVNFWTFTCVNWLRQLPYVRAWHEKYASQGLVVLGVHTPEFRFEHDLEDVRREMRADGIEYPVALDNEYGVWRAFDNHYWPALYLADADGEIRFHHFGEGEYERTEKAIQRLLHEAGADPGHDLVVVEPRPVEEAADWSTLESQENYTGYDRTERFASPDGLILGKPHRYTLPDTLGLNEWSLEGDWTMNEQATVSGAAGARLLYRFHARDLNIVAGAATPVRFQILVDGEPPAAGAGQDVDADGYGTLGDRRLYQLLRQPDPITDHTVEITFLEPGAETYSFTFG
ncbi:redoxin domain-containing protein [Actinoplanes sp. NPDC048796]|uniref:redoxin domain-containing protein n=1 Tax=Actinoplanes sp. NPDC048796 TaxID=3155640 RepID=UPI00340A1BFF